MGIIGVIVAASVPGMMSYGQQIRLKAATREMMGLLSLARSQAIGSRSPRTVLVNPDAHEAAIEETLNDGEPKRVRLSPGVSVRVQTSGQSGSSSGPVRLAFQPSGSLTGRSVSVILSNNDKQQTIAVTAATGSISVK